MIAGVQASCSASHATARRKASRLGTMGGTGMRGSRGCLMLLRRPGQPELEAHGTTSRIASLGRTYRTRCKQICCDVSMLRSCLGLAKNRYRSCRHFLVRARSRPARGPRGRPVSACRRHRGHCCCDVSLVAVRNWASTRREKQEGARRQFSKPRSSCTTRDRGHAPVSMLCLLRSRSPVTRRW